MNCDICGHPILEGQMNVDAAAVYNNDYDKVPIGWHRAHANPADHLPTLDNSTQISWSKALKDHRFLLHQAKQEERERAAKLTLGLLEDDVIHKVWGDPVALIKELAAKIRGEE